MNISSTTLMYSTSSASFRGPSVSIASACSGSLTMNVVVAATTSGWAASSSVAHGARGVIAARTSGVMLGQPPQAFVMSRGIARALRWPARARALCATTSAARRVACTVSAASAGAARVVGIRDSASATTLLGPGMCWIVRSNSQVKSHQRRSLGASDLASHAKSR